MKVNVALSVIQSERVSHCKQLEGLNGRSNSGLEDNGAAGELEESN